MKSRFIEITNKSIKVYDADTTLKELVSEFMINFIYAFSANIMIPFIVLKIDSYIVFIWLILLYVVLYFK